MDFIKLKEINSLRLLNRSLNAHSCSDAVMKSMYESIIEQELRIIGIDSKSQLLWEWAAAIN